MRAHIEALADLGACLALDTPGYGQSDPLPQPSPSLEDYGAALLAALDQLDVETFVLLGNATGAQIALAMAKLAPARVRRLILENCGHFDPADRAAWEEAYFPDLSPQASGAHLTTIWDMCAKQTTRFPWHLPLQPDQRERPHPPATALTAMASAFLLAGPGYDRAYRAAFRAEDAASFNGLTVPCTIINWAGSAVRTQLQALLAQPLPSQVGSVVAGESQEARFAALRQVVLEALGSGGAPSLF
jgi:pimeloyl-ACP methyl ester carboxylesterase